MLLPCLAIAEQCLHAMFCLPTDEYARGGWARTWEETQLGQLLTLIGRSIPYDDVLSSKCSRKGERRRDILGYGLPKQVLHVQRPIFLESGCTLVC